MCVCVCVCLCVCVCVNDGNSDQVMGQTIRSNSS